MRSFLLRKEARILQYFKEWKVRAGENVNSSETVEVKSFSE